MAARPAKEIVPKSAPTMRPQKQPYLRREPLESARNKAPGLTHEVILFRVDLHEEPLVQEEGHSEVEQTWAATQGLC